MQNITIQHKNILANLSFEPEENHHYATLNHPTLGHLLAYAETLEQLQELWGAVVDTAILTAERLALENAAG